MCALTSSAASPAQPASRRVEAAAPKPKIDWSRVSKPGDVLKAIQQKKEEAAAPPPRPAPLLHGRSAPAAAAAVAAKPAVACRGSSVAVPQAPAVERPAMSRRQSQLPPAPRRIVPQPRQAAPIVRASAAGAGHCRETTGRARGREAAGRTPPVLPRRRSDTSAAPREVIAAAPPPSSCSREAASHRVAPPARCTPLQLSGRRASNAARTQLPQSSHPLLPPVAAAPAAPAPAPRRVIMPQTGPRPVYTAPPAPAPAATSSCLAARSQRDPEASSVDGPSSTAVPGGPGQQRPGRVTLGGAPGCPGARRPMHPTRSSPTGGAPGRASRLRRSAPASGARPGFGQRPGPGGRPAV